MIDKRRITWIDYAKAFAIFCVVLLHANVPYPFKGVVRVFLIPLFFFMSGIFSNPQRYSSFREFMQQKGLHILVPYVCFNILTYLFWLVIGRHFGADAQIETVWWKPLLGILYGEYSQLIHYIPLWFLACLFTTESIYYLVFRAIKSPKTYWLTVLGFAIIGGLNYYLNPVALPWGISIALPMTVFYAVGAYFATPIRSNQYRLIPIKQAVWWLIGSLSLVLITYKLNPGEVLVFKNEYGNYILFYIGAFAGIVFMNVACRLLEALDRYLTWLAFIGRNTLVILCLHLIMFSVIKGITFYLFHLPLDIYDQTIVILVESVLTIALLVPIILFINRYCPFIIGKFATNGKKS